MAVMTSFNAKKCCHLWSGHAASAEHIFSSAGQFLIHSTVVHYRNTFVLVNPLNCILYVELSAGYYPSVRQRHRGFPLAAQDVFVCVTLRRIVTLFLRLTNVLTYLLTYLYFMERISCKFKFFFNFGALPNFLHYITLHYKGLA